MASNSHRVAPRDAQTQAIRPDAVRLRVAKEVEVGRRGQRDRLLSAKRMRVQSPVPAEQSARSLSAEDVERLQAALAGSNVDTIADALTELHLALVEPSEPVCRYILEGAGMDALSTCLRSANADLQLRALWCLSNLAAGAADLCLRALAAAPLLIQLLSSGNPLFEEQAAFTLGNMAADSPHCRDTVVANGALVPLSRLLDTQAGRPFEVIAAAAFAMANILHGGKQHVPAAWQTGMAPALVEHMRVSEPKLASEVAWILTYLTAGDRHYAAELLEMGVGPLLVAQLAKQRPATAQAVPFIRTLGNLICASDVFTIGLSREADFLPSLFHCLESDSRPVLKEALWTLSNFTVAPSEHVQNVESTGILRLVMYLFLNQTFDIRKEAMYVIANVAHHGPEHLTPLLEHGLAKGVVELLRAQDWEMVQVGLFLAETILRSVYKGPQVLDREGGMDILESLSYRDGAPPALTQRAGYLVNTYYGEDYEGVDPEDTGDGMNDNSPCHEEDYPAWRRPMAA